MGRGAFSEVPILFVIGSGHWVSGVGRVPPKPHTAALLPEKPLQRFSEAGGRERIMREGLSGSARKLGKGHFRL